MTDKLPPAGWYPDPNGKPGQTYWDGQKWLDQLPAPTVVADNLSAPPLAPVWPAGSPAPGQPPVAAGPAGQQPLAYAYKNPVLYAFGGLFFPPLVLFLMGGNRTTCMIMMGIWVVVWLTMLLFFLGVIPMLGLYIWSVICCHQEAVRQNNAHGMA